MNKIEITILDRPTADDKKTAVFPSRRVRKLGRRRTGCVLNFWDFGQVSDGVTWQDWMPTIAPDLTYVTYPDYTGGFVTTDIVDTINTALFGEMPGNTADWATHFRKMEFDTAERHGIEVYPASGEAYPETERFVAARPASRKYLFSADMVGDTPEWVDGIGLKVPQMPSLSLITSAAFYRFDTGAERCKVTTEPDFNADAVPFRLTGNCNVFLTPCYHLWYFNADDASSPTRNYYNMLGAVCRPYDREEYYNNATIEAITGQPVLCDTNLAGGTTAGQKQTIGEDFETWQKGVDNARFHFVETTKGGSVITDIWTDPTTFPLVTSHGTTNLFVKNTVPYNGLLQAVIQRGSNMYYVWGVNNEDVGFFGHGQPFNFTYTQA